MTIDALKKFLKVDGADDDDTILGLQIAAEQYLTNAGVKKDYKNNLYALAVKLLVGHWYDNRMVQSDKSANKLSFSLDAIIIQLKLSEDSATGD